MPFLEHYPMPLKIQFALICGSCLCYFFNIFLIILSKSYRNFVSRLFLYQIFSQLFILIPELIIPFISNYDGDPYDGSKDTLIGNKSCLFQGAAINFGWLSASFLSIYMMYCVLQVLNGNNPRTDTKSEVLWVCSIYVIAAIPNMIVLSVNYFQIYGWHYYNQNPIQGNPNMVVMYCFCQIKFTVYICAVLVVLMSFFGSSMVYLKLQISKRKQRLSNLGVEINHPILNVHRLAFIQLSFWIVNAIVKMVDQSFPKEYQIIRGLENIWAFLNIVYFLEAYVVTYIFVYFYLPQLKPNLDRRIYRCLYILSRCPCLKKKVTIHIEELDDFDHDPSQGPSLLNSMIQESQVTPTI